MARLQLDIWSDIACPWCYIGKRHLERALDGFAHKDDVDIVWRAFELDPSAPKMRDESVSYADRLAKKYGVSPAQGKQMIDRVVGAGDQAGLEFRYDRIKSGNTFDAHRLLHWSLEHGKQNELKERFMRGYMTDGEAIGDRDTLAKLAGDVGLDAVEARAILDGDRYTKEVRADEALARELGITGVPFFVMAGKIGVSGAQPVETMSAMLAKAWELAGSKLEVTASAADDDAAPACGPDGCD